MESPRSLPVYTDALRETVRQQLLGDYELMSDMRAGRENPDRILRVRDRIDYLEVLAREIGLDVAELEEAATATRVTPRRWVYLFVRSALVAIVSVIATGWFVEICHVVHATIAAFLALMLASVLRLPAYRSARLRLRWLQARAKLRKLL